MVTSWEKNAFRGAMVNFSGTTSEIFQKKWVNKMPLDDSVPCVARSSAAMALTVQYKQILVFLIQHSKD